jgi:adenosylcobinamide-GDP ribazoletransferase
MKRGVSTGPWGVWNRPQRAAVRGQRAVTSNLNGNPPEGVGCKGVDLSPVRFRSYVPPALPRFGSPAWLRDLAGAWIFYSVLPAWPGIAPRFERIARFAPCIGLVLGGGQALLWWGLEGRAPLLAQVALVLALGLLLTGGLHMDGAMDTADGLAAGERFLEAMEDSRVGACGAQALALLLLLRGGALACLGTAAPSLLPWAAVWGRTAPLLAMARFPYLRQGGSAAFHRHHWAGLAVELRPALLVMALLLALSWRREALVGLLGVMPALLVPMRLGRRLGGHSGDTYGACVEWSETLALLLSAAAWVWLGGDGRAPLAGLPPGAG